MVSIGSCRVPVGSAHLRCEFRPTWVFVNDLTRIASNNAGDLKTLMVGVLNEGIQVHTSETVAAGIRLTANNDNLLSYIDYIACVPISLGSFYFPKGSFSFRLLAATVRCWKLPGRASVQR